jgi:predicted ATPase
MRLRAFKAQGIHGYLNFDLRFYTDLTFLTGINGSGKTSVLNSIVALLTPDLSKLSNLSYNSISVDLEQDRSKFTISAIESNDQITLKVSSVREPFIFRRFSPDPALSPVRQQEFEAEHYKDLAASADNHPVMKLIASLPTPMFLGLDRRARYEADDRRPRSALGLPRQARLMRNVFSASLTRSVSDAAEMAETNYRDALITAGRIGERLQHEMLLELLTFSPDEWGPLSIPLKSEVEELARLRRELGSLPGIFRVSHQEINRRVVPFLDALQASANEIPQNKTTDEILNSRDSSTALSAMITWSVNRTQVNKIRALSDIVSKFNLERAESLAPTEKYLSLVNQFLLDSGKALAFNERGYLHVEIDGAGGPRDISCLSSGEAQIFVILTHLAFNPLAQEANIFIIDEPELSLHVRWQELFVDSVISANPNIQYVMATHSPSIILGRTENCRDLSILRPSGVKRKRPLGG